jgi:hypothetical protein
MKLMTKWLVTAGAIGLLVSNVACGGDGGGGSGGTTGGGGSTGSGGTAGQTPNLSFTFNTDKEGWVFSNYVDATQTNLGAATDPDSGVRLDGGALPTLEWANEGDPNPGCLKATVTFSDFSQYIDPQINLATDVDLSGSHSVVKARIRLVSGTFPGGGVQFHVSSGRSAYTYGSGPFVNASSLMTGQWITIQLNTADFASPFDGTMIVQIGVQFTTGSPFTPAPTFGPAVFEIDTVQG